MKKYFSELASLIRRLGLVVRMFVLTLLCVCSLVSAHASLPPEIQVSISQGQSEYKASDKIMLSVSYQNTSNKTIKVLKWDTVFGGRVDVDLLKVVYRGGGILPYSGRIIKRPPPQDGDYLRMAPGQIVTEVVDLLTGYDINYQGVYDLSVRSHVGGYANKVLSVSTVSFSLAGDRPITFKRTPVTQSCTTGRIGLINSALGSAESIARKARDDLQNTPVAKRSEARRYNEWFGAYSASRWATVQDHFNRIYSAISGRVLTFICDDTSMGQGIFAYVYKDEPYNIYLGSVFWNVSQSGTDSKAGTIIHELSHFNVLGGTNDHVYGQSGARSLARSDPNRAVRNADSHEYFAENTPSLSMPKAVPDLAAGAIVLSSQSVSSGDLVGVTAEFSNVGDAASSSALVSIRLSDDAVIAVSDLQVGGASLGALSAGQSSQFSSSFSAPSDTGAFWVGVCVSQVTGEAVVSNNCSAGMPLAVKAGFSIAPFLLLLFDDE